MNEHINELARKAGITIYPLDFTAEKEKYFKGDHVALLQKFATLIVNECTSVISDAVDKREPASTYVNKIQQYFGLHDQEEKRNIIGYTEREEGYYPLYAPKKNSIVTQAFILCKYCNGSIYHCMGPRYDAVCLKCIDPDSRPE